MIIRDRGVSCVQPISISVSAGFLCRLPIATRRLFPMAPHDSSLPSTKTSTPWIAMSRSSSSYAGRDFGREERNWGADLTGRSQATSVLTGRPHKSGTLSRRSLLRSVTSCPRNGSDLKKNERGNNLLT
jgi:hypothetical protein